MARAYGDDIRRKLLEAHAAGKGTLRKRQAWPSARRRCGGLFRNWPASEKKSLRAAERDTEENRSRREACGAVRSEL
jgi:hypothetical protein